MSILRIRTFVLLTSLFFLFITENRAQFTTYKTGTLLIDTEGDPVNAHGAGMLYHKGKYYLYGEIKKGTTWLVPDQSWECYRVPASGISVYSSEDLVKWKNEGIALAPTSGNPSSDLDTGNVLERPKVLYNSNTKKFVMWLHIDSKTYSYARAGVAISDSPTGPFTYLSSMRPNGNMARDLTVFQDEDQKAYLFYASEDNKTMQICLLSEDYLSPTTRYKRILIDQHREAPAVFKHQNRYYLITSGTTGWSPNKASYAVADSIFDNWVIKGNPCKGKHADLTFFSQSTFVLTVIGKQNTYLFLADRWDKTNLANSTYVWLPLKMKGQEPVIRWRKRWHIPDN